jgi:hypothetical protein
MTECPICGTTRDPHEADAVGRAASGFLTVAQLDELQEGLDQEVAGTDPSDLCAACLVQAMASAV